MAFVVARGRAWEIRQSRTTPDGPRSRTLATFRALDSDTIELAIQRSHPVLSADDVVRAARRGGAPVRADPASRAAAALYREIAAGRPPARGFRRLLASALGDIDELTDTERAAASWIGSDDAERGSALRDLLLLGDALPAPSRQASPAFPPFATGPA